MTELRQDANCILLTEKQTIKNQKMIYCFTKRVIDLLLSLLVLPVYAMVYLVVAAAIKFTDGGPVLYKSVRIGKDGQPFHMYKFRTMKRNADNLEDFLTPEEIEKYKKEYKLEKDPRITWIGNILRRTSMDELPQILNIINNKLDSVKELIRLNANPNIKDNSSLTPIDIAEFEGYEDIYEFLNNIN